MSAWKYKYLFRCFSPSLGYSSPHNKIPETVWHMNNSNLFQDILEAERSKVKRGLGQITDGGLSSGHRWYILLVLIGQRGMAVFWDLLHS